MKQIDYKKIRSFSDIEVVKSKVRYEMLMAENLLYENLMSIERIFTFATFASRFSSGFSKAQGIFSKISDLMGKLFHRKTKASKKRASKPEDIG